MKELKDNQVPETVDAEYSVIEDAPKGGFWRRNAAKIITGGISLALLALIIMMITGFGSAAPSAAANAYDAAKAEAAEEAFANAYREGYNWSEAVHHTSNVAKITVEKLQEKSELEVLNVSYDCIEATDDSKDNAVVEFLDSLKDLVYEDNLTLWQKYTCAGSYTVDLKQAEYVIDNANSYVLVRLPEPGIDKVDIISSETLYSDNGGLFNTSEEGADLTAKQRADAQEESLQALQNNEFYLNAAKDSAERFIINFIEELNPEIEDLTVEVEFV